jgi:O-antigen biosynthesis protein WbqP
MYRNCLKRVLDIVLSGLAILVLLPLFLIIAVWIKLDSRGPVFFRQTRVGIRKSTFEILKFRTMKKEAPKDVPTHLLSNSDQWITRAGWFLRRTSLDELPQLLQIFTGKMSIVGPRPALWNQEDLIAARDENGANDVRPGLTGWAQVNGRDSISIREKARLDGEYAAHVTFGMDVKCLWKTVSAVLTRKGFQEGENPENEESRDE